MSNSNWPAATAIGILSLAALCIGRSSVHAQDARPPDQESPPATSQLPPPSEAAPLPSAPLPSGPLPWNRGQGASGAALTVPRSARDMLAKVGIDGAALAAFNDRQPPTEAENDVFYRVLFRLKQMRSDTVADWTAPNIEWQTLLDEPAGHRLQFFPISGRAKQVARFAVPPEMAELHDLPNLWQVTVECEGAPGPVRLLAYHVPASWVPASWVPASWVAAGEIDEPVVAHGLFLKLADDAGGKPVFVFAANRFAWYPTGENEKLGVDAAHVYLASLGLDITEFAEVGDRSSPLPREPFYQLLAAVDMADPAELARRSRPFSIVELLQKPAQQRGQVITVTGQAQQITKILVGEPEIRKRYGIDHYYEIDMFVPLETTLQLTDPNDPSKQVIYHDYPVTVCVRELPEGLAEPQKANVLESVHTEITLPAVFFKVWAVSTARARKLGSDRMQFNPLFIGAQPQIVEREPFPGGTIGAVVAMVFLVALAAAWLGVWRSQRGDRKFERQTLNKQFEVKPGESLNELGIEAETEPDFSSLEQHDTFGKTPPE